MDKKLNVDVANLSVELNAVKQDHVKAFEDMVEKTDLYAAFRKEIEALRDKTNVSLDDLSNKIALLIKLTTVFNKRLGVFDDNEEVLEMLSVMYDDEALEDVVDKYALGESITHLAGLHESAVEFSQAVSDVLGITIEEEYDDMDAEEPIRKEIMGGRTPFSERTFTDIETLVEEAKTKV